MQLPGAFRSMMQPLLDAQWPRFEAAMAQPPWRGARLHHLDDGVPLALQSHLGIPIPWTDNAYYVDDDSKLSKTIYHEAGALYFQEPSAMAVAYAVQPKPGERILDLCAAPGSKTTCLARLMPPSCTLIANEIHPKRVTVLAENMERMGALGGVTNCDPTQLASVWPEAFDAILVDAPCSGEGMFRKSQAAIDEWTHASPEQCAHRQRSILASAAAMLKPGGRLLYSTCTFNPMENEQMVAWLEDTFPLRIEPLPEWPGWSSGRPDWADNRDSLVQTRRCWPHEAKGEGHFLALLVKSEGSSRAPIQVRQSRSQTQQTPSEWCEFAKTNLTSAFATWCMKQPVAIHKNVVFLDVLHDMPHDALRVLRRGTPVGVLDKGRFTPHHALSRILPPEAFRNRVNVDETDAIQYFSGEVLSNPAGAKGYVVITAAGLCLGFAKAVPNRLNNLYPKGLRKQQLLKLQP